MPARRLAVLALLAVALAAGPAAAGPKLFVGVAEDGLKFEPHAALADARRLGISAFRITFYWNPGQVRPTRLQAAQLDRALRLARDMRVVVAVYADAAAKAPVTSARRRQYCAFLANVLAGRPRLRDIVVWNEPNKSFFWQPQFGPGGESAAPAAYEALLAHCWDVVHRRRPDANLIAPATAPRGNDNPDAASNVSHSPATFIRQLGRAYRRRARARPIFDTVGHHIHGTNSGEPPEGKHAASTGSIGQGDLGRLLAVLADAFGGTAQPIPGRCVNGRCVKIWYLEAGYQTRPDPVKLPLYLGVERDPRPIADEASRRAMPDQAAQIAAGLELAFCQPHVEAFFNFLLWDEQRLEGWQSAPYWFDRTPKHSFGAFRRAIAKINAGDVECLPDEPDRASAPPAETEEQTANAEEKGEPIETIPPRRPFRGTPTTTAAPPRSQPGIEPRPRSATTAATARTGGPDGTSRVLVGALVAGTAAAIVSVLVLLRWRRSR